MTIDKKILPEYYTAVASGKKKFELRLNDFIVNEGDILRLREWDADKQVYTGRQIDKKVTYVKAFKIEQLFWPKEEVLEKGIVILSLE